MPREKTQVALPDNKNEALNKLFDSAGYEKTRAKIDKELPFFQYYLNQAVVNLQKLGAPELGRDEDKVQRLIEGLSDEKIQVLADFLWLFKTDNPGEDFKDYRKTTTMLVDRIFRLRNFFCHPERGPIAPLITDTVFYHFFAGWALGEARLHSLEGGVKSDRIFKMSIMNAQEIDKDDRTRNTFAFTRRGIVMLICMALYKDEAIEFCQALDDMKLPRVELDEELEQSEEEQTELRKKASIRKAYHLVFSYFSKKRSFNAVDQENHDFVCFTDIIGYLNKVPMVSMDYLALNEERERLAKLDAESTESEENRRFKYTLHRRMKDRFLSFITAYCEDVSLLPHIHFKRLDISPYIGRKRYCFGVEKDNSVRQSRHYAIEKDAIRFEWRAEQHYGDIHINALRSAISAAEFKRLMIASRSQKTSGMFKPDAELNRYFTAYHKVLEKMLNEPECDFINREGYLPELVAITGASPEELMDNDTLLKKMSPFFPENITRFFIPRDNIPSNEVLLAKLKNALENAIRHDEEFIARMDGAKEWADKYADVPLEKRPKRPRDFTFNDNAFIAKVFALLNLYLPDDRKFRQLPKGKQHRASMDFEYQTLHAVIGRFSGDQQELWDYLKGVRTVYRYEGKKKFRDHTVNVIDSKRRPQLFDVADQLKAKEGEFFNQERKRLDRNPQFDANGRPRQPRHSLQMLARAAVLLHKDFCKKLLNQYGNAKLDGLRTQLQEDCRKFGVRLGLPLSHDAILKTILHIDEAKWLHAFNEKENRPWENRSLLLGGHVVTQIPLPNTFTSLCLTRILKKRQDMLPFFRKDGSFDFNKLFREVYAANARLSLRSFYDVTPLLALAKTKSVAGTAWEPELLELHPKADAAPDGAELDKAVRKIKDVHNQDLLLLDLALDYHQRFVTKEQTAVAQADKKLKTIRSLSFDACRDIYDYFNNEEKIAIDGVTILLKPNDRLRSSFAQILGFVKDITAHYTDEQKNKGIDFYDLLREYRRIQARDRRIKIRYFIRILKLEALVEEPNLDGLSEEEIRKRLYSVYLPRTLGKKKRMTFEEFNSLVEFRNGLNHTGFNFTDEACQMADKVLKYFGIMPD